MSPDRAITLEVISNLFKQWETRYADGTRSKKTPMQGTQGAYSPIGTVTLRVQHAVYGREGEYLVESSVRSDPDRRYASPVSKRAVDFAFALLTGQDMTILDLATILAGLDPKEHGFQYWYGFQLRYEVERALLVLVAQGKTKVRRVGREFVFSAR